MSTRIGAWTIRLMGPSLGDDPETFDNTNQDIVNGFSGGLARFEEIMNNELPEGYYVKIEDH